MIRDATRSGEEVLQDLANNWARREALEVSLKCTDHALKEVIKRDLKWLLTRMHGRPLKNWRLIKRWLDLEVARHDIEDGPESATRRQARVNHFTRIKALMDGTLEPNAVMQPA